MVVMIFTVVTGVGRMVVAVVSRVVAVMMAGVRNVPVVVGRVVSIARHTDGEDCAESCCQKSPHSQLGTVWAPFGYPRPFDAALYVR